MTDIMTKVPFDPGFYKYSLGIDENVGYKLDYIIKMKNANQKKFRLKLLEEELVAPINALAAIYYGCVIYGSTIAAKYRANPAEITDNFVTKLPEDQLKNLDLAMNARYTIELYRKLNNSTEFFFKRQSKLRSDFEDYVNFYIKFVKLNDSFKNIKTTSDIILPDETKHFLKYTDKELEEIENGIFKIVEIGQLEYIFKLK